jgi:hypothetical protein
VNQNFIALECPENTILTNAIENMPDKKTYEFGI